MKRLFSSSIGVYVLVVLAMLASCASDATPSRVWAVQRDAVSAAQTTLISLHTQGVLDDADLVAIDPVMQDARSALAAAELELPGGGATFDRHIADVRKSLDKIAATETARKGTNDGHR